MHDPRCTKSGVYWSWNGGPREGRGAEAIEKGGQIMGAGGAGGGWDSIFENDQSNKVMDSEKTLKLFKYATKITGAQWPDSNQPTSPCPTLAVIGAVTAALNAKEEMERMKGAANLGDVDILGQPIVRAEKPSGGMVPNPVAEGAFVAASLFEEVAKRQAGKVLGELPDEAVEKA